MTAEQQQDVLVVGGGNAAHCAALAASQNGASVTMLEKAPIHLRGGNSYFTGGLFRFAYDGIEDIMGLMPGISQDERSAIDVGSYPQAQFYSDVMRVTEGLSDSGPAAGAGFAILPRHEMDDRWWDALDTCLRTPGFQA